MQLASTSSARPADTLPRLVAGLYTLLRDLTSSDSFGVLTFCGRNPHDNQAMEWLLLAERRLLPLSTAHVPGGLALCSCADNGSDK